MEKVSGKGGYPPPPSRKISVTGVFEHFPITECLNIQRLPVLQMTLHRGARHLGEAKQMQSKEVV